jgi:radical SAM protein with 4Fe4S-binding SPASM domain
MVESNSKEAVDFFLFGYFDSNSGKFVFNQDKYKRLKNNLLFKNIPGCEDCFAQFSCKGDCPANKAVVSPGDFYRRESYRCEEIRDFIRKTLSYVLNNGTEGLLV